MLGKNFPMVYEVMEIPKKEKKEKKKVPNDFGDEIQLTDGLTVTVGTASKQTSKRELNQSSAPRFQKEEQPINLKDSNKEKFSPEKSRYYEPVQLLNKKMSVTNDNLKGSMRLNAGFPSTNHPIF